MRLFGPAGLTILLIGGCAGGGEVHGPHHPGDLPYACGDGRIARITYENGGWFYRARASLAWDGRNLHLRGTPTDFGLRYVSADETADPIVVWTVRGEEAWIGEIARSDPAGAPGREVARCTRVREGAAAPAAEGHGEGGDAHH